MNCPECQVLLMNYHSTTDRYADKTQALFDIVGVQEFNSTEFQRQKIEALTAREQCISAREALRIHQESHATYGLGTPMHPGDQYEMKRGTLGIFKVPRPNSTPDIVPVVVPAGCVVKIVGPEGTFVEVECDERIIFVFGNDVRERGFFLNRGHAH